MPRTTIQLSEQDQAWLNNEAQSKGVALTDVVRQAIALYRQQADKATAASFDELLENTRGIWKNGDGLSFQNRLREEWDRR